MAKASTGVRHAWRNRQIAVANKMLLQNIMLFVIGASRNLIGICGTCSKNKDPGGSLFYSVELYILRLGNRTGIYKIDSSLC